MTTSAGTLVKGGEDGIDARNFGKGALTITADGHVTGRLDGIAAANSGTYLSVTTGAGTTVKGGDNGIDARNLDKGTLTITANGDVIGTNLTGINARTYAQSSHLRVTTGVGTSVKGGFYGIDAKSFGSGALDIIANGDVTGGLDGISAYSKGGGPIAVTVGSESTVTSNGTDAGDFAIDIRGAPGNVTVAGTLNGGGGGAIRFHQDRKLDDRLELHPTAIVNGKVLAGDGTDTLAFGGAGNGAFDLSNIDTGASPQQYRGFELFQVDSGTWNFSSATAAAFTVNGGTLKGAGTFGGLTVNGGTLAPGNSIGTMTVNGAFTLGAGAIYEVEVNAAGQNDKVVVNGTVNLTGATLRVLAANGDYKPKTDYVIIDNDGTDAVTGVFAAISSSLAFLSRSCSWHSN